MPIKLILLGVFVVGVTIGTVVASKTGSSTAKTGGGSSGGGGTQPSAPAIVGQYSGTLALTDTQSIGDSPGTPHTSTISESITFVDTGLPQGVNILNYGGDPDLRTTAVHLG